MGVQISPSAPLFPDDQAAVQNLFVAGRRTFTGEDIHERSGMVAGVIMTPEESPSCAEQGCPVKVGETDACRPLTVQIGTC